MVFASICRHARSAFIFARMSSGQICLASKRAAPCFPLGKFCDLFINVVSSQAVWLTPPKQDNRQKLIRQHVKILSRCNQSQELAMKHPQKEEACYFSRNIHSSCMLPQQFFPDFTFLRYKLCFYLTTEHLLFSRAA